MPKRVPSWAGALLALLVSLPLAAQESAGGRDGTGARGRSERVVGNPAPAGARCLR